MKSGSAFSATVFAVALSIFVASAVSAAGLGMRAADNTAGISTVPSSSVMRLDAEECRILAAAGVILSLMELMERVKLLTDGHMLDTILLQRGEEYIYEMEVAGKDGIVRRLQVDARTGAMIEAW